MLWCFFKGDFEGCIGGFLAFVEREDYGVLKTDNRQQTVQTTQGTGDAADNSRGMQGTRDAGGTFQTFPQTIQQLRQSLLLINTEPPPGRYFGHIQSIHIPLPSLLGIRNQQSPGSFLISSIILCLSKRPQRPDPCASQLS